LRQDFNNRREEKPLEMFLLFLMAITATGQIATKTISFSSEKHCQMVVKKVTEKTDKDVKVIALCIDLGLAH
jgi:hypothetical protein